MCVCVYSLLYIISHVQVCQCNGNYAGYDCSRCKFGHYGDDCSQSQVLPRRPIASYTDEEWVEFIEILQMLRTHDSNYTVFLEESVPGNSSLLASNVTLYKLYVWLHHSAARDSFSPSELQPYNYNIMYTVARAAINDFWSGVYMSPFHFLYRCLFTLECWTPACVYLDLGFYMSPVFIWINTMPIIPLL